MIITFRYVRLGTKKLPNLSEGHVKGMLFLMTFTKK
jgi:hypothetical protein